MDTITLLAVALAPGLALIAPAVALQVNAAAGSGRSRWGRRLYVAGFAVAYLWVGAFLVALVAIGELQPPAALAGLFSAGYGIVWAVRARRRLLRTSAGAG